MRDLSTSAGRCLTFGHARQLKCHLRGRLRLLRLLLRRLLILLLVLLLLWRSRLRRCRLLRILLLLLLCCRGLLLQLLLRLRLARAAVIGESRKTVGMLVLRLLALALCLLLRLGLHSRWHDPDHRV